MKKNIIQIAGRTAILIACFAAVVLFGMTGMHSYIENRIFDTFFHLRDSFLSTGKPDTPVAIVCIDRKTMNEYKVPVIFWDREFSETIRAIASARPRAIGFDVLHLARADASKNKASKEQLKETILETDNIVLPYSSETGDIPIYIARHLENAIGLSGEMSRRDKINILSVAEKTTGIGFGFVELTEDDDGIIRRASLVGGDGVNETSFPLRLFMQYHGITMNDISVRRDYLHAGSFTFPLEQGSLIINFPGPPGSFPTVSMVDVNRKKNDPAFLARHFKDRVVLIGVWDKMLMDAHYTPYVSYAEGGTRSMFGAEIIAGILDTMLRQRYIRQSGLIIGIALCLAFALGGIMLTRMKPAWGILIIAAAGLAYIALAFALFAFYNFQIAVSMPLLALPLTFGSGYLFEHYILGRDRTLLQRVLQSYLDPRVVERVVGSGDIGILKGQRREITVLFADIRNFTALSEKINRPEDVVEILNTYLPEMCGIILASEGCVDKFIGDGIMAFWNAPNDVDGHAAKAVMCAMDMQERMKAVNEKLRRKNLIMEGLKIGIGIHTGTAVVGNIGSETKTDYTAIGDTVNLASRLEGKTKDYKSDIIISDSVYKLIGAGDFRTQPLGRIEVKGKKNKVQVYGIGG